MSILNKNKNNFPYDRETVNQLDFQYKLIKILSTLKDLKTSSGKFLKIVCELFEWDLGFLWTIDKEKDKSVLTSFWFNPQRKFSKFVELNRTVEFSKGEGVVGRVWKDSKLRWIYHIDSSNYIYRKEWAKIARFETSICFPLKVGKEIVGIAEFFSREERKPDKKIKLMMGTIGNQIALGIKRIMVEQEKEESKRQLEAVFKSVPEGITLENRKGEILYANDSIAKMLGLRSGKFLEGKTIESVLKKFRISDVSGKLYTVKDLPAAKIFSGKRKSEAKLSFINSDTGNENWFYIKAIPISTKGKTPHMVVKSFQNITILVDEQKERELFLGLIGHELKSPLTSIKAFSQLLTKKMKPADTSINKYVKNLDKQTDRLIALVNNLLDVTKIRSGFFTLNKRKFSFDALVDEIVANFQITVPQKIVVKGKTGIVYNGDDNRIAQVLNNLLSNASRYSNDDQKIIVTRSVENKYLTVSVKDFGIGIAKEDQKKVFKLYRRIKGGEIKNHQGLGMGLFISSAIIQAHGGAMTVKSKVGFGSAFTFKLPFSFKK